MLTMIIAAGCGGEEVQDEETKKKVEDFKVAATTWKNLVVIDTAMVGDSIEGEYIFYNSGWKPVFLTGMEAKAPHYCVCDWREREVKVGEQDTVRVKCFLKYAGDMRFSFRVYDNTKAAKYVLNMHAFAKEEE